MIDCESRVQEYRHQALLAERRARTRNLSSEMRRFQKVLRLEYQTLADGFALRLARLRRLRDGYLEAASPGSSGKR